jgi:CNT family concentrative nucleoside transporter
MTLDRIQSLIGFFAIAVIAWFFSERRKGINLRTLLSGFGLQFFLALFLLKLPGVSIVFIWLNELVQTLEEATMAGTGFVFGYLGGGPMPFIEKSPGAAYILAFRGLPLVLVISALSALLFYWKVIPPVVKAFSWLLRRVMGVGGVEGLGTAANIFVGMVEAPLFVRPYLANISRSELFTLMVSGMATIAGTVMVLYASILSKVIPGVMGHLLTASIISVPAAITVAKIMVPETDEPSSGRVEVPRGAESWMDAITSGTLNGVKLLINIIAMLIVLVALVHLLNLILGYIPELGGKPVTFQRLLGYAMAPLTWLMGVPWNESVIAGALMGTKTVLNEFLAYVDLASLPEGALSERSRFIMTYAMCGFANFGSLGIMIGGMGAMVRERRNEIIALGIKSIIAGTLATCMTGALVGLIF